VKCPVDYCEESTTTRLTLCIHMEETHGFKNEYLDKTFESEDRYVVNKYLPNNIYIILGVVQGSHVV
jgi:hypothetical protein